jgi:predicted peptidase
MRRNSISFLIFILVILFCTAYTTERQNIEALYKSNIYTESGAGSIPYRILEPSAPQKSFKYPLVLFLHGAGERGIDNIKQLLAGCNILTEAINSSGYKCYILAPQCPEGQAWSNIEWKKMNSDLSKAPTLPFEIVIRLAEHIISRYNIDPDRVYVTGYSMGGFGTWEAIERRPDLFAAAVPVCGGGDIRFADRITGIPVWAYHGRLDSTVPVERSRDMIKQIIKKGGNPIYTEYPDINHYCWGFAYSDMNMIRWLFNKKRNIKLNNTEK